MYMTSVLSANPFSSSHWRHAGNRFVHAQQRFAVEPIVFGDVGVLVVREVDAVPAVALVLQPERFVLDSSPACWPSSSGSGSGLSLYRPA